MQTPLTIWRFTDGKRGHENQTLGLVEALRSLTPMNEQVISCADFKWHLSDWFQKRFPLGEGYALPDLLLGAGRLTHRPMLCAKRAHRAPAVVLMNPAAWLRSRFDLCFVPEHDAVNGANVVATRGALTAVQPGGEHAADRGLFLIGGPSAHHAWDGETIVAAVRKIVEQSPTIHWTLTTSRRTPVETTEHLLGLGLAGLEVIPVEQTSADWVPAKLATSSAAWVTEDSVSMVYEALSSGAATGTLPVPRKNAQSRVVRGLDRLVEDGHVTRFDPSLPVSVPTQSASEFNEAGRCARILLQRFFPDRLS